MTSAQNFCIKILLILLAVFGGFPAMAQSHNDEVEQHDAGDYSADIEGWKKLAEQGDPDAQFNLGHIHYMGQGVPQDYAEAASWYRLSAEQGDPNAQRNLGYMYSQGRGVPQDYAEAVKWYRLSAEQCNPYGQINLGLSYKIGKGVDKDLVQAHMWFNLAASLSTAENHPVRKDAEQFREEVASGLARDELARAQHLARELYESRCQ